MSSDTSTTETAKDNLAARNVEGMTQIFTMLVERVRGMKALRPFCNKDVPSLSSGKRDHLYFLNPITSCGSRLHTIIPLLLGKSWYPRSPVAVVTHKPETVISSDTVSQ